MTIRVKLTMATIAVIVIANSLVSFFTVRRIGKVWLEEVQMRIRLALMRRYGISVDKIAHEK